MLSPDKQATFGYESFLPLLPLSLSSVSFFIPTMPSFIVRSSRVSPFLRCYFSISTSTCWNLSCTGFSSQFQHLKKDQISKYTGSFIRLPQLYEHRDLAKGLTPADCESFLLTKERLALWEEMDKANGIYAATKPLSGTCLSGPNGVGKSSALHMLASIAHANDWIVLYIVCSFSTSILRKENFLYFFSNGKPKSGEWSEFLMTDLRPNPTPASIYLLERFVDLNEANATKLDELRPGLWGRISSAIKGDRDAFDTERELFKALNRQKKYVTVSWFFSETIFPFAFLVQISCSLRFR